MTYEQTEALARSTYERENPGGWEGLDEQMKAKLMSETAAHAGRNTEEQKSPASRTQ